MTAKLPYEASNLINDITNLTNTVLKSTDIYKLVNAKVYELVARLFLDCPEYAEDFLETIDKLRDCADLGDFGQVDVIVNDILATFDRQRDE